MRSYKDRLIDALFSFFKTTSYFFIGLLMVSGILYAVMGAFYLFKFLISYI